MTRKVWTSSEVAYLTQHFPNKPTSEVASELGRSACSINGKAEALGLAKSEEYRRRYLRECGLRAGEFAKATRFPKGHIPHNAGTRRPGWHAGRVRETQFRKGERRGKSAQNWRPVGTILKDSDGYLRIKVRETVPGEATGFGNSKVWMLYHRYLWQREHGPVPPKHIVVFRDGNRENCTIDNLQLITMAENAYRNRMWNKLPPELCEVIQLKAALKRKIRRIEDGKENKAQPPA